MSTMELGIEYRDEDWEHGLRCAECDRPPFQEGERYSERFDGLIDDIPCVLIVCLARALEMEP